MSHPTSSLAKPLIAIVYVFVSLICIVPLSHVAAYDPTVICATECITNAVDPCGDGKAQSPTCASTDFITMISKFGYTNTTELPNGFVGCSQSICNEVCKNVNMTVPMEFVTDDRGTKVFCFPTPDSMNGMFMMQDLAEMAALSNGCSGSHEMNGMFMWGSNHMACMDSYSEFGVKFVGDNNNESSSSHAVMYVSIVSTTLSLFLSLFAL
jgi:hypothetical protein